MFSLVAFLQGFTLDCFLARQSVPPLFRFHRATFAEDELSDDPNRSVDICGGISTCEPSEDVGGNGASRRASMKEGTGHLYEEDELSDDA